MKAAAAAAIALARSMQFTSLTTLAYTEISPERMSRANRFLSAVMQLSLGIVIGLGTITLRMSALLHGHSGATPMLRDFHLAIFVVAGLALAHVLDPLGLSREAGASTSGDRQPEPEVNPA